MTVGQGIQRPPPREISALHSFIPVFARCVRCTTQSGDRTLCWCGQPVAVTVMHATAAWHEGPVRKRAQ
eukprot:354917-Chlamydomonas_euryale.AAC.20